jgi:hypothetical protein
MPTVYRGFMSLTARVLSRVLATFAVVVPCSFARAETPIFLALPGFDREGVEALQVNGDAVVNGSELRLTRDKDHLWGAALYTNFATLGPESSFSSYFTFKMTRVPPSKDEGADGFAFLVQTNLTSKGGEGRTIGYAGAGPSLLIEFDTHKNGDFGDPNNNHIGINLNGNTRSVITKDAPFKLNSGDVYHTWVDYDGTKGLLEIRLSDSSKRPTEATFSHWIDLSDLFAGSVYVGFSAATGASHEQHDITSFYFHNELVEGGLNPESHEYVTDPVR